MKNEFRLYSLRWPIHKICTRTTSTPRSVRGHRMLHSGRFIRTIRNVRHRRSYANTQPTVQQERRTNVYRTADSFGPTVTGGNSRHQRQATGEHLKHTIHSRGTQDDKTCLVTVQIVVERINSVVLFAEPLTYNVLIVRELDIWPECAVSPSRLKTRYFMVTTRGVAPGLLRARGENALNRKFDQMIVF